MKIFKNKISSILLITGSKNVMKEVFQNYKFGYWSAAFDLLLEKHGWLDFDMVDQEALGNCNLLSKYQMVIVSWLPEIWWNDDYIDNLKTYQGLLFLEGPYPQKVEEMLGLKHSGKDNVQSGQLVFHDPELSSWVNERFQHTLWDQTTSIQLSPKCVETKRRELARQELRVGPEYDLSTRIHDVTLSYLLAYRNRYKNWGCFFQDDPNTSRANRLLDKMRPSGKITPMFDALSLLAWTRFVSRLEAGEFFDSYLDFLTDIFLNQNDFSSIPKHTNDLIAFIVRAIAMAEGSVIIKDRRIEVKAKLLAKQIVDTDKKHFLFQAVAPWYALLLFRLNMTNELLIFFPDFLKTIPGPKAKIPAPQLWLYVTLCKETQKQMPDFFEPFSKAVENHMAPFLSTETEFVLEKLNNRSLWECLLFAAALQIRGENKVSRDILSKALSQAYDLEKSLFQTAKVESGKFQTNNGFQIMPWVLLSLIDCVDNFSIWDPSWAMTPYSIEQLVAWERSPLLIHNYVMEDKNNPILSIAHEQGESVGIFQKGKILGTSFPLLSHLVHFHTMHPLKEAFSDCIARQALVLEHVFFKLLYNLLKENCIPSLQVHSWPWDKKYCLIIRHDVDRPMLPPVFQRLLQYECDNGLGVSWYWLPGRFDTEQIHALEEAGHEIGLHSLRLANKKDELKEINNEITAQDRIYGEQWHGGGGGDYWIGHPSVRSAVEANLLYTEFVSTIYDFPYSAFPYLNQEGHILTEPIVGTTWFMSMDNSARLSEKDKNWRLGWIKELADNGYCCVLLNHPDSNYEELVEWVGSLPNEKRQNWTHREVSQWWKKTHSRKGLRIFRLSEWQFSLAASEDIKDLELHISCPSQSIRTIMLIKDRKEIEAEWREEKKEGTYVRVRLDLLAEQTVQLNLIKKEVDKS